MNRESGLIKRGRSRTRTYRCEHKFASLTYAWRTSQLG